VRPEETFRLGAAGGKGAKGKAKMDSWFVTVFLIQSGQAKIPD
jgi:hypothetical protein